ncbi:hypothetical protein FZEAL_162 [Fusarium zealandicum]|uniref:ASST-domain-containing protein n=1 Tax=Fusarium zealandicum TaxID=1053134 RepID=A0A8H4UV75_9HYPO|nr:hypothetical protein FZEAL_162 [Fusarium zealandicum]
MVALSGSPWVIRLVFTGVSLNLMLWWFLLQSPQADKQLPPSLAAAAAGAIPVKANTALDFNSWSSFEVITPKNSKTWPFRKFKSSPHKPPHMVIGDNGKNKSRGYIFLTPESSGAEKGVKQTASFIMRPNSEMVYAHEDRFDTKGIRVQSMNNAQYLTMWRGVQKNGHGFGEVVLIDSEYEKSTVKLEEIITNYYGERFPGKLDFHEQELTTRGTILVTAYNTTNANLSASRGREQGFVLDSMFFEIDIETQDILFSWSSLDHFRVEDSMLPPVTAMGNGGPRSPYDFFHLNSVQAIGHDSFLISSRHFWSVYLISRFNGKVIWELKGNSEGGSFGALPTHGRFRWQNHVRGFNATSKGMIISMFDNHNSHEESGQTPSRGLLLKLKLPPNPKERPTVLRALQPDVARFSQNYGSYQLDLSNGNQFVSYGTGALVHEFGPGDGTDLRWEARFGYDNVASTYRAFKNEWSATPAVWSPALVVEKTNDKAVGFVSWNGATDIEAWNVYLIAPGVTMRPLGKAAANGFETGFDLPSGFNETNCIMVAAVKKGSEVRQSNVACLEGRKFKSAFKHKKESDKKPALKVTDHSLQRILGNLA